MRLPIRILSTAILSAFALAPAAAFAIGDGTPDESPPAEETAVPAGEESAEPVAAADEA